jgi:purine-binding chemotaxis protein CheW
MSDSTHHSAVCEQLVTLVIDGQLFGLPIQQVRDVFVVAEMTKVPLATTHVAGLFNLRGHVLTMLSMRALLGLPGIATTTSQTAIGIDWRGESLGLLVDRVGEVMTFQHDLRQPNPANLDPRWASLSAGVYRLDGCLLVQLSLDHLLTSTLKQAA